MGTRERELASIRVQIAVANWHLHDALSVSADVAIHKLECARLAYAGILRSVAQSSLTDREREEIARELGALRSCFEPGASPPHRKPPSRRGAQSPPMP